MKTPEEKRLARNAYMREYNREYRSKNKDRLNKQDRKRAKAWRAAGNSRGESLAKWRIANPDSYRESYRRSGSRANQLMKDDPGRKMAHTLRSRLCNALRARGLQKPRENSAVRDLGCSIQEFRSHIEKQFSPGMSWANHGQWHIDHIRPLSSFDLRDPDQIRSACHYSNLQPLWATDNLRKGAKI